ncbi:MAG TPA: cyclic nucleotide-binding domain-containing protein, partial [Rhodocyclaceae bacterium]
CYRVPAGSEIIREGERGDFMLLLIEGSMEIAKKDHRGLPVQIGDASPGKTLGEMSVIDGEPRFASCISVEQSIIAVLGREELLRLIAERPQLGVKLVMRMAILLNQRLRQISVQYMKVLDQLRSKEVAA